MILFCGTSRLNFAQEMPAGRQLLDASGKYSSAKSGTSVRDKNNIEVTLDRMQKGLDILEGRNKRGDYEKS